MDGPEVCWVILSQHTFYEMYSRAIVPYVARRRNFRKMGFGAARLAYQYGPRAVGALKTIGRAARRWKKKKSYKRLAVSSAIRTTRVRAQDTIRAAALQFRFLEVQPIRIGVQGNAVGQRRNITVNVSGIKICEVWHHKFNGETADSAVLECHWALCRLKAPLEDDQTPTVDAIKAYIAPKFFRENGVGVDRETPFVEPTATMTWDFRYNCLPLNPDRFNILSHKKFILTAQMAQSVATGSWMHRHEKYYKLKTSMTFANASDQFGKTPYFIVRWHQSVAAQDFPNNPITYDAVEYNNRHKVYFRD